MRCQLCLNFSWQPLCKNCLNSILQPSYKNRVLNSGLQVHSFFTYEELKPLLLTKHTYLGNKIFHQLGKHAFIPFLKKQRFENVHAIPVDDHVRSGYSHTAVLCKSFSSVLPTHYGALRAKNHFRYSGQKRSHRSRQKRDFTFTCKALDNVILVDDIVTTGLTLEEANHTCKENGVNVLFALTLADAKE